MLELEGISQKMRVCKHTHKSNKIGTFRAPFLVQIDLNDEANRKRRDVTGRLNSGLLEIIL